MASESGRGQYSTLLPQVVSDTTVYREVLSRSLITPSTRIRAIASAMRCVGIGCSNNAAKSCPASACGKCCTGCTRHKRASNVRTAGEDDKSKQRDAGKVIAKPTHNSHHVDIGDSDCYDLVERVERAEALLWARRDAAVKKQRLAKPVWVWPQDGLSNHQLIEHHANCRHFSFIECPICHKHMKAYVFSGCAYGVTESHCAKHVGAWLAINLANADGLRLSAKLVSTYARLVVQYCTPSKSMSLELLRTFPGWPLRLDHNLCAWVQACMGVHRTLPSKSFDYRHWTDSGPDSDTFDDTQEDGPAELQLLQTFDIDLCAAQAEREAAKRLEMARRLAGVPGIPPLQYLCAMRVSQVSKATQLVQKGYPRSICDLVYRADKEQGKKYTTYVSCCYCYENLGFAHYCCVACGGNCCKSDGPPSCYAECVACKQKTCKACQLLPLQGTCPTCWTVRDWCAGCDPGEPARNMTCEECIWYPRCSSCEGSAERCVQCNQVFCHNDKCAPEHSISVSCAGDNCQYKAVCGHCVVNPAVGMRACKACCLSFCGCCHASHVCPDCGNPLQALSTAALVQPSCSNAGHIAQRKRERSSESDSSEESEHSSGSEASDQSDSESESYSRSSDSESGRAGGGAALGPRGGLTDRPAAGEVVLNESAGAIAFNKAPAAGEADEPVAPPCPGQRQC